MKFLEQYRDYQLSRNIIDKMQRAVTKPWTIMEVCGGQTHSILQYGIEELLPKEISLVHGPGCPVCVTPIEIIDKAQLIAEQTDVIFCSFGDMLRVPGSKRDLLDLKALGADVRIVYSPLDCLQIARAEKNKRIVFFAVGFETTAPANAMAAWQARNLGLDNFFLLCSHVLVPPALTALLNDKNNHVQGFLGPGHVCSVVGWQQYEKIAQLFNVPIVISGFEPLDILEGVYRCLLQLEAGRAKVENQYARAVNRQGNLEAQKLIAEVFEICDREWRGIGLIEKSGLRLNLSFAKFDAEKEFSVQAIKTQESADCISGLILKGQKKPHECPVFGTICTPEHPLGATMVSSEGTCANYYKFGYKAQGEK